MREIIAFEKFVFLEMKAQGGNVNSYIGQADLFPFPLLYPLKEKK